MLPITDLRQWHLGLSCSLEGYISTTPTTAGGVGKPGASAIGLACSIECRVHCFACLSNSRNFEKISCNRTEKWRKVKKLLKWLNLEELSVQETTNM
jgi:hypothetical protein